MTVTDVETLERLLAPYSGDVSEIRFYIAADNDWNQSMVFVQFRCEDGRWRGVVVDCMGVSPGMTGGRYPIDTKGIRPYVMTHDLDVAMPMFLKLKEQWLHRALEDCGFDSVYVESQGKERFAEAVTDGDTLVVRSVRRKRSGELRHTVTIIDPVGGGYRHYYNYEEVELNSRYSEVPEEEAERIARDTLDRCWESWMAPIHGWYAKSQASRSAKPDTNPLKTGGETMRVEADKIPEGC